MKILLVNPRATQLNKRKKAPTVPLGLLAVASYIRAKGHEVQVADLAVKAGGIERIIKKDRPDVVGVSFSATLVGKSTLKVSKTAKRYNIPVVWGGHMPSALPELCFKEGCVDFIVIGEGEVTFAELLEAIEHGGDYSRIAGLATFGEDGLRINTPRAFADLADFPVTDWSLIDPAKYCQVYFSCKRMIYLYFSKGCPAKCTFCYSPGYHRCTHRKRPPGLVVDEIEYLVKRCGVDGINFSDEYWNPGPEDMKTFFRLIKEKKLNFVWGCQTRLGAFGQEELRQMYEAGCRWILFGIESGNEERIKAIKKGIRLDEARDVFAWCREIGITAQSSFIIGYPGETREELRQTVRFAMELDANLSPFNVHFLQPGSEAFETAVKNGLYQPPSSLKEWEKLQCDEFEGETLSHIPRKELLVLHFYAQWRGFSQKESVSADSYGIVKQLAIQAFKNMFKFSADNFFVGSFASVRQFFTVLWYAKAYPGILEKYGLRQPKGKRAGKEEQLNIGPKE